MPDGKFVYKIVDFCHLLKIEFIVSLVGKIGENFFINSGFVHSFSKSSFS